MVNRFNFRCFDKINKTMIYFIQRAYNYNIDKEKRNFDEYLEDDNYVVMQSTGITDKNGTEIFEGDVLDNKDCSDSKVKVVFLFPSNENGNRYGFYLENLDTHSVKNFSNPDIDLNKLEVISNVYENEDLKDMTKKLYESAINLLNAYKKEPNTINAKSFDYMVEFIADFEGKKYGDIILKIKNG